MKMIFLLIVGFNIILFANFIRNDKGIVTDNKRELQWQDNEIGDALTWQDAIARCESLTLGDYNNWRVPNIRELISLVDDNRTFEAINPVFKKLTSAYYWSSTSSAKKSSDAWIIRFFDEYKTDISKSNNTQSPKNELLHLRCVRNIK